MLITNKLTETYEQEHHFVEYLKVHKIMLRRSFVSRYGQVLYLFIVNSTKTIADAYSQLVSQSSPTKMTMPSSL